MIVTACAPASTVRKRCGGGRSTRVAAVPAAAPLVLSDAFPLDVPAPQAAVRSAIEAVTPAAVTRMTLTPLASQSQRRQGERPELQSSLHRSGRLVRSLMVLPIRRQPTGCPAPNARVEA